MPDVPEPPKTALNDKKLNLGTLVAATALGALSMSLFLPSLPNMARYFETSPAVMQLTVTVYMISAAILQLFVGPISDRIGRRPAMIGCIVVFIFGTIICQFAPSATVMIIGRAIQACGTGGLVVSRAIIRDVYSARQSASMLGYVTMGMAIAPMLAPIVGGFIEQHFGWRANFTLMLTYSLILLTTVWFRLFETHQKVDETLGAQFRRYPTLLKSGAFWWLSATAATTIGSFYAFLSGGPFIADQVLGLSPAVYGVYFGITPLGFVFGNFASGKLSVRVGVSGMMLTGALVSSLGLTIGIVTMGLGFDHPAFFFAPMVLVGFGNGLTLPNAMAGMVSIDPTLAGTASGLGGSVQMAGGASLAITGGWIATHYATPTALMLVMLGAAVVSVLTSAAYRFHAHQT